MVGGLLTIARKKDASVVSIRPTFRTFKLLSRKYFGKLGTLRQNFSDIISSLRLHFEKNHSENLVLLSCLFTVLFISC